MMREMDKSKGGGDVKSENHSDQREPSEYAQAKSDAGISDTQTKGCRTGLLVSALSKPLIEVGGKLDDYPNDARINS